MVKPASGRPARARHEAAGPGNGGQAGFLAPVICFLYAWRKHGRKRMTQSQGREADDCVRGRVLRAAGIGAAFQVL